MNTRFDIANYALMIFYLGFTILIGIIFSKKEKNTEEYFLGGRCIPTFVIAVSMFVTVFSAISFVAVPGEAFANGLSMFISTLIIPIGTIVGFSMFVKFYFKANAFTPFTYLEQRYDRNIRILISVIFILMKLFYLGIVMYASAKCFKGATGWPIWKTILIVGIIGIFYTTLGGMKAVVWTDFLQFFILVIGLGVVFWKIFTTVDGGIIGTVSYAFENERGFEVLKDMKTFTSFSIFERFTVWMMLLSAIGTYTFTYGCDQMTIQRLLSTSSYREARKATITNVILIIPIIGMFWLIGLGLFSFYNSTGNTLPDGIHQNEVMSYFMIHELPTPVPGLLMAALLAAVMSTIDSGMNSLSAVFVKDIYITHFNPQSTTEQEMKISRITTIVWGIIFIAFGITVGNLSENIVSSVFEIAGIWGALFGIPAGAFLLGVTTKRAHKGIIYACSAISIIALSALVYNYYTAELSHRISFNIVGTSPFIVMIIIGYPLCMLWPAKEDTKSTEGLTLWTYKKS
ncbi:MAG: sodium/solute symporter [Sedimentisphaeraceae bacterium JB056]